MPPLVAFGDPLSFELYLFEITYSYQISFPLPVWIFRATSLKNKMEIYIVKCIISIWRAEFRIIERQGTQVFV